MRQSQITDPLASFHLVRFQAFDLVLQQILPSAWSAWNEGANRTLSTALRIVLNSSLIDLVQKKVHINNQTNTSKTMPRDLLRFPPFVLKHAIHVSGMILCIYTDYKFLQTHLAGLLEVRRSCSSVPDAMRQSGWLESLLKMWTNKRKRDAAIYIRCTQISPRFRTKSFSALWRYLSLPRCLPFLISHFFSLSLSLSLLCPPIQRLTLHTHKSKQKFPFT